MISLQPLGEFNDKIDLKGKQLTQNKNSVYYIMPLFSYIYFYFSSNNLEYLGFYQIQ